MIPTFLLKIETRQKRYGVFVMAFFSGIAFSAGFSADPEPLTALVALVVFFYTSTLIETVKKGFLTGWLFGLGWFGIGLSWITNSIVDHGHLSPVLAWIALWSLAAFLALLPAIVFAVIQKISTHRALRLVFGLPALWSIMEWVRAEGFLNFGWLSTGYAALDTPLAGWIPIVGIYGLNLLCAFFAALLALAWGVRNERVKCATIVAVALSLLFSGWCLDKVNWSEKGETINIVAYQANLPVVNVFTKVDPEKRLFDTIGYLKGQKEEKIDFHSALTVLPEGVLVKPYERLSVEGHEALEGLVEKDDALLLNGFSRQASGKYTNRTFYFDEGALKSVADKRNLVPFGEYIPPGFAWFVEMIGIPMGSLQAGPFIQDNMRYKDHPFSVLNCYENLYPQTVKSFWQNGQGPDFMVVTANLGWFGTLAIDQHLAMSRMRAKEVSRPIVSVNNNGGSAYIDEHGVIQEKFSVDKEEMKAIVVPTQKGDSTIYARLGDLPTLILTLLLLVVVISPSFIRKR